MKAVLFKGLKGVFLVLFFTVWPLVNWLYKGFLSIQLFKMAWHWHVPGDHSGWMFALYFVGYVALLSLAKGLTETTKTIPAR